MVTNCSYCFHVDKNVVEYRPSRLVDTSIEHLKDRVFFVFVDVVKAVLHTGDFRFCSDMTCNEILRACRITTLILDTTYCDPQVRCKFRAIVSQLPS